MSGVFENVRCIFKNKLGDLSVKTVFDSGFYDDFDMAPDLHAHGYYELLFSLEEGFLLELADGETVNIPTGASCLIPPGTYHGTRQLGERSKKLALRFRYVEEPEECGESLYFQFDKAFSKCKL